MGIIDEIRDHDGTTLTEIVLPLMNVDRRDAQGDVDPTEPNQQQVMITSAGTKGTYAYEKLIETFIQSIIAPESAFVWGWTLFMSPLNSLNCWKISFETISSQAI